MEKFVSKEKRIKNLKEYSTAKDKTVMLLKYVTDVDERVDDIESRIDEIKKEKGEKGDSPTREELLDLITPLIPPAIQGEPGKDYVLTPEDKKEIAESIKVPVVEKIVEKTEVIKEQPIVTQEIKEVAKYETAEQIVEKLGVDIEELRGLADKIKKVEESVSRIPRGNMRGMRKVPIVTAVSLSSQCDGATRTFTLPKDTVKVLGVWASSFPITFDTADWTLTGNTLVLSNSLQAPQTGQTLMALVETLFYQ